MAKFDRSVEDLGNIVCLEHVNTRVPDQQAAIAFYVMGLGLARDPYIMTGTTNMWINVGRSQFHLPTGGAQVLRGATDLVIPGRTALIERLAGVRDALQGSRFSFAEQQDHVAVSCPWGNRIRIYEPGRNTGPMRLGMPRVELDVPIGSTPAIARFYNEIIETRATSGEENGAGVARAAVGDGQTLVFRETDAPQPEFDGHHIAVYLADFSGPYNRLLERGLISEESDQHQYRFLDIIDPGSGKAVFRLEHEVRSMRHPMYARPLVNRNPMMNNRNYVPGYEDAVWSLPG
ncbi:MAG TPA: hypothetical protein VMX97_15070 [Hyphomicrobiaceae bacterium]|nr:hypothetical protein [Hyphomicrobiaceae bacterium]